MNRPISTKLKQAVGLLLLCVLLFTLALSVTGCAKKEEQAVVFTSLQDFSGRTVGYATGGIHAGASWFGAYRFGT